MTVKELIEQLKMVQKIHEWKEIQVKIWTIEKWEVKEKDLILQNIVESNYDWKTTIILTNY
jgi:hypothetical protein